MRIPVPGGAEIEGDLGLPEGSRGIVTFAHGSGSSRHSPRNRMVAEHLRDAGLGTLMIDLLTEAEETIDLRTGELRFDIDLLADRLLAAAAWLREEAADLTIGYFGASTGAAAALVAAAEQPEHIEAIVSRGGRPDLAGRWLQLVEAPTLLIVGGLDTAVIEMNRDALEQLKCEKALEIVPGATHLFEEPGTLEEVARLSADWFARHLAA